MISAQTRRVCREEKPLHTFPDHALVANLDIAAAALAGTALRKGAVFKMAAAPHRSTTTRIADDLSRTGCRGLRPPGGQVGATPDVIARPTRRTLGAIETIRTKSAVRAIGTVAPVALVALGDWRLAAPLLAFIIVVEERALGTDDPGATVAVGLETVLADQGTDTRRLLLDGVERIVACRLGVELGLGIAVEQRQRALRRRVPVAIGIRLEASDAAQFALHRFRKVGLRRPVAERGHIRALVRHGCRRRGQRRVGRAI